MKLGKAQIIFVWFFLLSIIPVYGQRGTLGLDGGATSDKFGPLPSQTSAEAEIEGQLIIVKGSAKDDIPNIVAGGDIVLPEDTSAHASEFAGFGGLEFMFGQHLTLGFHIQGRKFYMPSSTYNGQVFGRDNMFFLELPAIAKYKFGPGNKAFIEARGAAEFSPKYSGKNTLVSLYGSPSFDHGYVFRGSAGYVFGKWYAKATYENRFLKWGVNLANPFNLYNWRTNSVSAGVGLAF